MASEFDLIQRYFTRNTPQTLLGVGDDAALIKPSAGMELAISTDILVAGTHFFADTDAYKLGWKTLAVNLSDMAAMGAKPRWATLGLVLPEVNEPWLAKFSEGFFACADTFGVDLVGGDTTRGPLTLSVQIMGEVPAGKAIRRDGAKVGDEIWVSGELGTAALALAALQNKIALSESELSTYRLALEQPEPQVHLGIALRNIANSMIDISDGLLADLGHILERSKVGAHIHLGQLPTNAYVSHHLHEKAVQMLVLAGGDDYELCFTAPKSQHAKILEISQELTLPITCIGTITAATDGNFSSTVYDQQHHIINIEETGFDHFA